MKVKDIKQKVAAKVAKGKAKVAAKCGKGRKCAALAALLAFAVAGCHMGEQPTAQRAQTAVTDVRVYVYDGGSATFGSEFVSQAQANETSGTETMTTTPSNTPTVSTPVQIDARYNDAFAAASAASKSVLESLTSASVDAVLELMQSKKSGKVSVVKTDGSTAVVECRDGQCSFCSDCER